MAEFDLASVLAGSVSNLNTGHEAIEYIDRENIHADPGNFYSMEGIDQLAANIELCGLMDPIRVRPDGEGYMIVSGHRRFAAMTVLAKDGNETYRQIPCIVDSSQQSAAMQELRLIYANSDTRKLSSADLAKQVERVTELLYKLQEEGVNFPGRMRDHVAEACKLSKSKIARLNAIQNGLGTEAYALYKTNKINESIAYRLSTISKSHQNIILSAIASCKSLGIYEHRITDYADKLKQICKMKCPKGDTCEHLQSKMNQIAYDDKYWHYQYCHRTCCLKCDRLALCKNVCTHATAAAIKAKEQKKASDKAAREEKKAEAERQNQIAKTTVERYQAMYQFVADRLKALGLSKEPLMEIVELFYRRADLEDFLAGKFKDLTASSTVFCTGIALCELDRLCAMADYLQLTVDQLIMHTPVSADPPADPVPAAMSWQTGTPTEPGMYAVKDNMCDFCKIVYWFPVKQEFSFNAQHFSAAGTEWACWLKLPEIGGITHEASDAP